MLEGYLAVYLNLDKVIKIIRTEDEPKPVLMKAFKLTENQAEAILNMRLRSLRKLEEMEIRAEHDALTKEQKELKKLLGSDKQKSERLIAEMKAIDAKFGAEDRARQAPHRRSPKPSRRQDRAIAEEVAALEKCGRARADHGGLLAKGLAARLQGPSGTQRRRSNTARATADASGFMPKPPTS